jgi:1-aminocyclopropane-1-carboxylate deaminase/D-cysteine desulfhydrase-like pyridoxal-dependent ACC family enzyme
MLAMASMCKTKGWEFIYYTKPISKTQKELQSGNYYHAKRFGMWHVEIEYELYKDFIASLRVNIEDKAFLVDQGGADTSAKEGLEVLASEIRAENLDVKSLATPSGTGTTALYLALAMPEYKVYTTSAIGDVEYLKEQMSALETIPDNLVILEPSKKYHFAKLYPEFLEIYKKLLKAGVEFDLLYAPGMWKTLLEQTDEEILYIHSGGVSGNESMLSRYMQKGFV